MARLTPAEQIEQSYDDAMKALADYLTREDDTATTVDGCSASSIGTPSATPLSRFWWTHACIHGRAEIGCAISRSGLDPIADVSRRS
jgi:hypothetical protein